MNSSEDKIVAAIDRNTEAIQRCSEDIDKFRSGLGWVGMWLFFIWIVLLLGVGCPRAKADPRLPPLGYEIGEPPAPPPNPNVQYWYTMDVPGPQGVLPVEVFAPRLVAQVASEPQGVEVETPEPGTAEMLALALLIVALTASARWRIHAWMKKRKAQEDAIARLAAQLVKCRYALQHIAMYSECLDSQAVARKALEESK